MSPSSFSSRPESPFTACASFSSAALFSRGTGIGAGCGAALNAAGPWRERICEMAASMLSRGLGGSAPGSSKRESCRCTERSASRCRLLSGLPLAGASKYPSRSPAPAPPAASPCVDPVEQRHQFLPQRLPVAAVALVIGRLRLRISAGHGVQHQEGPRLKMLRRVQPALLKNMVKKALSADAFCKSPRRIRRKTNCVPAARSKGSPWPADIIVDDHPLFRPRSARRSRPPTTRASRKPAIHRTETALETDRECDLVLLDLNVPAHTAFPACCCCAPNIRSCRSWSSRRSKTSKSSAAPSSRRRRRHAPSVGPAGIRAAIDTVLSGEIFVPEGATSYRGIRPSPSAAATLTPQQIRVLMMLRWSDEQADCLRSSRFWRRR